MKAEKAGKRNKQKSREAMNAENQELPTKSKTYREKILK